MGVSWTPRLSLIHQAVVQGCRSAPVDRRYLQRPLLVQSSGRSEVFSYLMSLYESTAECMPHDQGDCQEDPGDEADPYAQEQLFHLPSATDAANGAAEAAGLRFLPPGTLFDLWRQYCEVHQTQVSFKLFWTVFHTHFANRLLQFRPSSGMHSVCAVCIKHKLLLRQLAADATSRLKQRALYDRHLASQYADRQHYWRLRSLSRARGPVITVILDGMDQAKFAWPRSPEFSSHEFDSFNRPRLHVWGALVHGWFTALTISHADVSKGGSTTCEVLSVICTRLKALGVDMSQVHLNIQLDNTSGSNKNNSVLSWASTQVQAGHLSSCTLNFLRTGHTHEDIDQLFGELAKWIRKRLPRAETLDEFETSLNEFLAQLNRPHEPLHYVWRINHVRNWKVWLEQLGKKLGGIGGPSAPHVYEFAARRGSERWFLLGCTVELCPWVMPPMTAALPELHPLRAAGAATDVVLRCPSLSG